VWKENNNPCAKSPTNTLKSVRSAAYSDFGNSIATVDDAASNDDVEESERSRWDRLLTDKPLTITSSNDISSRLSGKVESKPKVDSEKERCRSIVTDASHQASALIPLPASFLFDLNQSMCLVSSLAPQPVSSSSTSCTSSSSSGSSSTISKSTSSKKSKSNRSTSKKYIPLVVPSSYIGLVASVASTNKLIITSGHGFYEDTGATQNTPHSFISTYNCYDKKVVPHLVSSCQQNPNGSHKKVKLSPAKKAPCISKKHPTTKKMKKAVSTRLLRPTYSSRAKQYHPF
jgi:hypothetical protein